MFGIIGLCCRLRLNENLEGLSINCKLLEKTAISRNGMDILLIYFNKMSIPFREMAGYMQFIKRSSEYSYFLQNGLTITLAVVAALQTVVIGYGLEKHYQTFSRFWVVVKTIFNFVKSKIGKKGKVEEEKEKGKAAQMKIRKSSFKRLG